MQWLSNTVCIDLFLVEMIVHGCSVYYFYKVDQDQPHKQVLTSCHWHQIANQVRTKSRLVGNQIPVGRIRFTFVYNAQNI